MMIWPHPFLPPAYTGSIFRVPTITCWQLNKRVALVKGLNPTPHGTSWRRPCSTLHSVPKEPLISQSCRSILAQVRFLAYYRIKPHTPPLVRPPVNSFEFHSCGRTSQVDHLILLLRHIYQIYTSSDHRLQHGLPGSLILFAPHAFVSQRQYKASKLLSLSVFLIVSKHFTATL